MGKPKSNERGKISRRKGTQDFWAQKEARAQNMEKARLKQQMEGNCCKIRSHPIPLDESRISQILTSPGPQTAGDAN
jgi:hypothetical protein